MRVEELERRLKARTLELDTEIRGKERLRSRIDELTRRISELEETASSLHREAVSATARSQELDETLRVASRAREHLASALEAEQGRREAAEKAQDERGAALESARAGLASARAESEQVQRALAQALDAERARREAAEQGLAQARSAAQASMKHDAELRDARRMVQAARQKIEGHEAHIDSLRSEVEDARQGRLEAEKRCAELEPRARAAMDNAEAVRREGVEAFEKAREAALSLQLKEDKFRRESAGLEALKSELRARAERELSEMRRALDAERERMLLDLEAERRGSRALGPGAEAPSERFERLRAESEERRRGIESEAREAVAANDTEPPSAREPWQVTDEIRLLLWVSIGVSLVAAMVASVLFLQN